jgi:hypothetical protein
MVCAKHAKRSLEGEDLCWALELFVEEFAESGFEFGGVGLQHFVVAVPGQKRGRP